ncbi:ATP-grasp domain-containing protein [Daejeonella oryzae]|uniref:ATP-grasp domain-containing protein n=1 Tax=Daejeonella oryzae TaxID=1122943 RepID=UPI00040FA921|nr:ATP-grasp domain-containing protein [Daejeonella oryzae]
MNILFTCVGRRNYLIKYFKKALRGKGNIVAVDSQLSASALAEADISIQVPAIYDPQYIESLQSIIEKHNIHAIICLNDLELPIMARNKMKLEKSGVKVLVSDEKFIDISFDKWKTYKFFSNLGILTPKTFLTVADTLDSINMHDLSYPLILKPRWGSASIGIEIVENENEFLLAYQLLKIKLKKSILKHSCAEDEEQCILIQEKIEADEYGMDILNDFNGKYYSSFARKKLAIRSGETDKAMSVIDEAFADAAKIIGSATGHIGTMDCDFFLLNNKIYFLEMNPRFGGGYPFSHEAGIDTPSIYISWLQGNFDISRFNNYKHNVSFSKYDTLISSLNLNSEPESVIASIAG